MKIFLLVDNFSGQPEKDAQKVFERATEQVSLLPDLPGVGGITRWVSLYPDGTVVVEDVPTATGMNSGECAFDSPKGDTKVTLRPPRRNPLGGFKSPRPTVEVDGRKKR